MGNWSGHLPFASDLVTTTRPELLVELGTHYGESYFGFCQTISEGGLQCKCYAIDTWTGEAQSGHYGEEVYDDVSSYNERLYSSFSYLLRTSFDEARENFSPDTIDILHIDGLHTYDAVRHDFDNWFPSVKPGGLVLLHDISARHGDFGVWKLWQELQERGQTFEFTHSWGLGVFRKPGGENQISGLMRSLLHGTLEERELLQRFYLLCSRNLDYEHQQSFRAREVPGKKLVQVYPQLGSGYSPETVFDAYLQPKVWDRVRIDLLTGSPGGALRIDILEESGVIDIAGISVHRATSGEPIFKLSGASELTVLRAGGTAASLSDSGSAEYLRIVSTGNDPQLYLQMDETVSDQPLVLEMWLRVDTEVTALLPMITSNLERLSALSAESLDGPQPELLDLKEADDEAKRRVNQLIDQIKELKDENSAISSAGHARLQALEAEGHARLQALENEMNCAAKAHEDKTYSQEAEVSRLSSELADLTNERDAISNALRLSQSSLYVSRKDLGDAQQIQMELRTSISSMESSVAALSGENQGLKAMQAELEEHVHQLDRSLKSLSSENAALQATADELVRLRSSHSAWETEKENLLVENKHLRLRLSQSEQLKTRVSELETECGSMSKTINGVLRSRSWRLTAPFRRVSELRRKA